MSPYNPRHARIALRIASEIMDACQQVTSYEAMSTYLAPLWAVKPVAAHDYITALPDRVETIARIKPTTPSTVQRLYTQELRLSDLIAGCGIPDAARSELVAQVQLLNPLFVGRMSPVPLYTKGLVLPVEVIAQRQALIAAGRPVHP
jgi:hypothetical protein